MTDHIRIDGHVVERPSPEFLAAFDRIRAALHDPDGVVDGQDLRIVERWFAHQEETTR